MTLDQMTLGLFVPWALEFTAGGVFLGSLSVVTGKYVKQFSCVNIFLKLHKHILVTTKNFYWRIKTSKSDRKNWPNKLILKITQAINDFRKWP